MFILYVYKYTHITYLPATSMTIDEYSPTKPPPWSRPEDSKARTEEISEGRKLPEVLKRWDREERMHQWCLGKMLPVEIKNGISKLWANLNSLKIRNWVNSSSTFGLITSTIL